METFGFEQAKQQYSLSSFQLKANQFKQEYFKKSIRVNTFCMIYALGFFSTIFFFFCGRQVFLDIILKLHKVYHIVGFVSRNYHF